MKTFSKKHAKAISFDVGNVKTKNAPALLFLKKQFRIVSLALLLAFISMTQGYATTVTLSTPTPVVPASMCPGTAQVAIYAFTLTASDVLSLPANFTALSFTQSGSATNGDITQYRLWSGAPGGTLVATSTTTSFSGFSKIFVGALGTTVNYWITADIAIAATAGRTITVDPMTTANFTTSSGLRATFGTIAAGGAQTVLLAPTNITGITAACVGATTTLINGISGGTWSSSNTGIATVDPVTGVVTGISPGTPVITYLLSTGCLTTSTVNINPLPALYSLTGGGSYCAGGAGVHIGLSGSDAGIYYQLYAGSATVGDPAGVGGPLDFGLQTAPGIYTVLATNLITSCNRNMTGSATVNINPLPIVYTVTGGGTYCAGGAGFHIGLSGSNTGINYRLYLGETAIGDPIGGTGAALDFGIYTAAGNYTVYATNTTTNCSSGMAGSATININPLPPVFTVTGGGNYCAGRGGVHIGLNESQTGIIYVLYNGSSTVGIPSPGTGDPLDFGLQTASGNYTVVAINALTACSINMAGSATVLINPLPIVYTVNGGGSYCAEGAGLHVGLSSSDEGIMYLLYNGTTIVGVTTPGTGTALDFGLQTAAGSYTVVAVNSVTTCMNNMAGAAIISINPLPTVYTVTGGGNYCSGGSGVNIGLSGSDLGINYRLYISSRPGVDPPGTGGALDFGLQTTPGIYDVVATNIRTSCTNNMAGIATININPLPPLHRVTGGGYYCTTGTDRSYITVSEAGGVAIHVGLDGSDPGMIYLLYNGTSTVGSPVAGTGEALDFGTQYGAGTYTIYAIDAVTLCTQYMDGNAVITINPIVSPTISIFTGNGNTACQGRLTTFTALIINGGTAPEYLWKVNGTIVGTSSTYSYIPANGDEVIATITSNAICANPVSASNSMLITVISPIVPSVSITAYPGTHIISGEPVTFTANITDGGTHPLCQWFVNGNLVVGVNTVTFTTRNLSNNDAVSCIVTRNDACAMTSTDALVVTVSDVGITEVTPAGYDIIVMPNPSKGTFIVYGTLGSTERTEVSLTITNILGQVVYKNKVVATNGMINEQVRLSNVTPGMYILNVRTASENKAMHLIVQQ